MNYDGYCSRDCWLGICSKYLSASKYTLSQHINIYKNWLRIVQKTKEFTYIQNGCISSQLINTCKCVEFCSFPINHQSLHFSNSTIMLVEYKQGWLNWAFTSVIILTNLSSFGLDMRLKVIGARVWNLFWDVCLTYRFLNLSSIFHSSFKPFYLLFE